MNTHKRLSGGKIAVVASALMLVVAGCSSTEAVTLEDLGLQIEADIQAGSSFEVSVPMAADTVVEVISTPPGVTATISDGPTDGTMVLSITVDADTPRGAYNIALNATREGDTTELGFPFEVVEPELGSSTTVAGPVDALLVVDNPQPGGIFESGSTISGQSSSPTIEFRLTAGDVVITEGTAVTVDGLFDVMVEFENTCCIEMLLEVFQPGEGELSETVPVAFPESS